MVIHHSKKKTFMIRMMKHQPFPSISNSPEVREPRFLLRGKRPSISSHKTRGERPKTVFNQRVCRSLKALPFIGETTKDRPFVGF